MAGAALAAGLLLGGCKKEPREFVSVAGRFQVVMPHPPRIETQTNAQGEVVHMVCHEEHRGAFGVIYKDVLVSTDESPRRMQQRLDQHRDWVFQGEKGAITSEQHILLGGKHPGRRIEGRLPDQSRLRADLYLVNGRLYQVIVIGAPAWVASEEATRFLRSFALREAAVP